ncbi:molybdate ABC transporter permease subunit [Kaarinaea lacus]
MEVNAFDPQPIWLTLQLASVTVLLLLLISLPIAWWLAHTKSKLKVPIEAITALPLVLPPTVLGFYLLVFMGGNGPLGQMWVSLTGHPLSFSFAGLVVASCVYSLPFVVQPLQAAFESLDRHAIEAAWTLGASRSKTFFTVIVPQARRGLITATVLGFAHTIGEFGVVLMVGGNIPGQTQVVSIAIYEHVETLDYVAAHALSAGLVAFSFVVLFFVYGVNRRWHYGLQS